MFGLGKNARVICFTATRKTTWALGSPVEDRSCLPAAVSQMTSQAVTQAEAVNDILSILLRYRRKPLATYTPLLEMLTHVPQEHVFLLESSAFRACLLSIIFPLGKLPQTLSDSGAFQYTLLYCIGHFRVVSSTHSLALALHTTLLLA